MKINVNNFNINNYYYILIFIIPLNDIDDANDPILLEARNLSDIIDRDERYDLYCDFFNKQNHEISVDEMNIIWENAKGRYYSNLINYYEKNFT